LVQNHGSWSGGALVKPTHVLEIQKRKEKASYIKINFGTFNDATFGKVETSGALSFAWLFEIVSFGDDLPIEPAFLDFDIEADFSLVSLDVDVLNFGRLLLGINGAHGTDFPASIDDSRHIRGKSVHNSTFNFGGVVSLFDDAAGKFNLIFSGPNFLGGGTTGCCWVTEGIDGVSDRDDDAEDVGAANFVGVGVLLLLSASKILGFCKTKGATFLAVVMTGATTSGRNNVDESKAGIGGGAERFVVVTEVDRGANKTSPRSEFIMIVTKICGHEIM
uniref:Uncharacterized protein n=1 Tax=Romanomermis culicivorax TaxID=13658 RepID=A0A915HGN9_ROMCU